MCIASLGLELVTAVVPKYSFKKILTHDSAVVYRLRSSIHLHDCNRYVSVYCKCNTYRQLHCTFIIFSDIVTDPGALTRLGFL